VPGLGHVTAIAAGASHACALLEDQTVACWGDGFYGDLGSPVTMSSPTPIAVRGVDHVTAIAASNIRTCALRSDASVWCWGYNAGGVFGDAGASSAPVAVMKW
jgi:alpha-tubulin suppressor-like RCC1 family protein